jgi:hypothetical protein
MSCDEAEMRLEMREASCENMIPSRISHLAI